MAKGSGSSDDGHKTNEIVIRDRVVKNSCFGSLDEPCSETCEDCKYMKAYHDGDDNCFAVCHMLKGFIVAPGGYDAWSLHADLMRHTCKFFMAKQVSISIKDTTYSEDQDNIKRNIKCSEFHKCANPYVPFNLDSPEDDEGNDLDDIEHDLYQMYVSFQELIAQVRKFARTLDDAQRTKLDGMFDNIEETVRRMVWGDEEDENDDGED